MTLPAIPPADYAELALSVKNLRESVAFYHSLGFRSLPNDPADTKAARLTDGRFNLLLRNTKCASPRIHYHFKSTEAAEQTLRCPNGMQVMLLHGIPNVPPPDGNNTNRCGRFGELAIPVKNLQLALDFWLNRGLQIASRDTSPYPWALLDDGHFPVGLHQTNAFTTPAITCFSSDSPRRIKQLKAENYRITDELQDNGEVAHATLLSPDNQPILIFLL